MNNIKYENYVDLGDYFKLSSLILNKCKCGNSKNLLVYRERNVEGFLFAVICPNCLKSKSNYNLKELVEEWNKDNKV